MLMLLYLSVYVVTPWVVVRAQPSGTVKCTAEPGATWSTNTASSGMSPGGLNSVGCAESGAEAGVLAGGPGLPECPADALDVGEPAAVGAEDGPLAELHPARAAAARATTLAMAAVVAARAFRGFVMLSTLGTGSPADGQRKVSGR
ncbi:hypothetical protein GCM10009606_33160 [Nocardioides aquiterrae]|uniref:Uncharacterized protein n=1 Tax=Nocardioides aquiterrae TaxID=203799 RepID=A0ABP4F2I4_9ACTN